MLSLLMINLTTPTDIMEEPRHMHTAWYCLGSEYIVFKDLCEPHAPMHCAFHERSLTQDGINNYKSCIQTLVYKILVLKFGRNVRPHCQKIIQVPMTGSVEKKRFINVWLIVWLCFYRDSYFKRQVIVTKYRRGQDKWVNSTIFHFVIINKYWLLWVSWLITIAQGDLETILFSRTQRTYTCTCSFDRDLKNKLSIFLLDKASPLSHLKKKYFKSAFGASHHEMSPVSH